MWRSKPKVWITWQLYTEWINLVFGPAVKKYPFENNLPLKTLLFLDKTPTHNLEDDILKEFQFIKIL